MTTPSRAPDSTSKAAAATARAVRVALVWNGAVQSEHLFDEGEKVVLGGKASPLLPLPDGVLEKDAFTLLEPQTTGYRLRLAPAMGGDVWIGGARTAVRSLAHQGDAVTLGAADYGVVTLGPVAVFFQEVRKAKEPKRDLIGAELGAFFACVWLSAFLHIAALALFLLARREMPAADPLELPTDLVAKFMVTPPPEDLLEEVRQQSGTNTEDPGFRAREEEGGRRAEKEEGTVGREDSQQERTEIEGPPTNAVAVKVRSMGLLGALSGGRDGNLLEGVLDGPSTADLLGGLGATRTVLGRGSGGMGLRGTGTGGGGDGPGSLFGAGNVGTGVGAGRGTGLGRGGDGVGVKGRPAREAAVRLQTGTPRVSGYLSAEQINRVVRANAAAIRYCYEVEVQRQPSLSGQVEVQWRINLQGAVTSARVASSSLNNSRVEGCMVRQIRRWQFDEPDGGEVVVTYPFIFGVGG